MADEPFRLLNFFDVELLTQISAIATEIEVSPEYLSLFDTTTYRYALILTDGLVEPEIVWVVGKNTKLIVLRGQEGTVARNWLGGTRIVNGLTAGSLSAVVNVGDLNDAVTAANTAAANAASSALSAQSSTTTALGYMNGAELAADGAAVSSAQATIAKNDAVTAKTGALAAEASAISAKDLAVAAQVAATTQAGNSLSSANASASSATTASAQATLAQSRADAAETSRLAAVAAQTGANNSAAAAEIARSDAVTAKTDAQAASASASTSATLAATSATNAGNSAAAAATSASNASTSATSAGTSATSATNSANTATTQANNASTSASAAATSASNAAASSTSAGSSATSASNSANTATTQAANASSSASAAATSASSANTSSTNAASSATSASNSANTASVQAGNAAASASSAATSAALADSLTGALAIRTTTLEAKLVADQQADYLTNGQFLRGTNGWVASGGVTVNPQTPEGVSGRNGVALEITAGTGVQYYESQFAWPNWRAIDLAWVGITSLWGGGTNTGAAIRVFLQGRVGAGAWANIAFTSALTDIEQLVTPKTLRGTAAAGYDSLRLLFELTPPSSGSTLAFVLTQRVSNWTGEFPSLDAGPRAVLGTEARIATEESVRASADAALATRATTLEARSFVKGNLVKGSRPNYDTSNPNNLFSRFGWRDQGLWNVLSSLYVDGPYLGVPLTSQSNYNWYALCTNAVPVVNGTALSAQAMLAKFGTWNAGTIGIVIYWYSDTTGTNLVSGAPNSITQNWEDGVVVPGANYGGSVRLCQVQNQIVPTGAQSARIGIFLAGATGNGVYTEGGAFKLKLEYGSTCTGWTDEALAPEIDARVRVEESVRASADAAQASQITTLTAKVDGNPNLFPYPQPITNRTPTQQGWIGNPIGTLYVATLGGMVYFRARAGGPVMTEAYYYDLPDAVGIATSLQYTLSASGYGGAASIGDRLYMYIEVRSSDNSTLLHNTPGITLNSGDLRTRYTQTTNFVGGYTVARLRVVFIREWPASGAYQDVVFSHIKLEAGTVATAFTNTAQVQISSQAIATLNDSAAFFQILVAASGGDPALIRLFSGLGGSEVALAAKILSLVNTSDGSAMPVMRAVGGLAFFSRPISSDFGSRRVTLGPGYGVSGSEVVLWFGPSTIAPADQSRTNCIFALGTDGNVYYGGLNLQVGGMWATLNLYDVNLTRSGAGATSQSMTATGYAPGTISYLWELISGDVVNIGNPIAATTNIGHSLLVGQTKTSVVRCTMTSSAGPTTFRLLNISSSEIS